MKGARRTVWGRRARFDGREQREALLAVPLFSACRATELERIDSLTFELQVEKGRVLARQQLFAREAIFIISGRARVSVDGAPVDTLHAGSCIGGTAVLAPGLHRATVTADTPMVIRVANAAEYRSLLAAVPRLASANRDHRGFAPRLAELHLGDQRVSAARSVVPGRVHTAPRRRTLQRRPVGEPPEVVTSPPASR